MKQLCYNGCISTIVRQFKGSKKALSLGMALLFVGGAILSSTVISTARSAGETGILGGPSVFTPPPAAASSEPSLSALPTVSPALGADPGDLNGLSEASFGANAPLSLQNKDISAGTLQAAADEELDNPTPSPKPTLRLTHYFIQPAAGTNWGILHAHNAVDIANVCGTPVVAAAGGVVTDAQAGGDWNGGYGNYIEIEHPNGVSTRYAHLQSAAVTIGDEVRQGAQIGTIGATGHVVGATGCHLHFEVHGAVNPFAKR